MIDSFDDPNLKQAVHRAWGDEVASPLLRRRIEQLISKQANSTSRVKISNWRAIGWGWAIAAVILLSCGFAGWRFVLAPRFASGGEILPDYIALGMVHTHDGCCLMKDHHRVPGVGPNDFPAIGEKLSAAIQVPVISVPVENWQFAGAAYCAVRGHLTGHLLYRQGKDTLSIFSVRASDLAMKPDENEDYVATVGSHYIAGFLKSGGLYCVVVNDPDGTMSAKQTCHLRDHLQDTFNTSSIAASNQLPTAKLALAY